MTVGGDLERREATTLSTRALAGGPVGEALLLVVRSEWLVGDLGSRVAYQLDFILRSV